MKRATVRPFGLGRLFAETPRDQHFDELVRSLGAMITPDDAIEVAVANARGGERIVLLPGEYRLRANLVVQRDVTLVGLGAVTIRSSAFTVELAATGASLKDLHVVRDSRGALPAVLVSSPECVIDGLRVSGPTSIGIVVSANDCRVSHACFAKHSSHVAGDVDVRFEDTALRGIVVGGRWSVTRQFSVSYKTGTSTSEAGNGPPSVIEIRP